jgi:hypothetical protein
MLSMLGKLTGTLDAIHCKEEENEDSGNGFVTRIKPRDKGMNDHWQYSYHWLAKKGKRGLWHCLCGENPEIQECINVGTIDVIGEIDISRRITWSWEMVIKFD